MSKHHRYPECSWASDRLKVVEKQLKDSEKQNDELLKELGMKSVKLKETEERLEQVTREKEEEAELFYSKREAYFTVIEGLLEDHEARQKKDSFWKKVQLPFVNLWGRISNANKVETEAENNIPEREVPEATFQGYCTLIYSTNEVAKRYLRFEEASMVVYDELDMALQKPMETYFFKECTKVRSRQGSKVITLDFDDDGTEVIVVPDNVKTLHEMIHELYDLPHVNV